ncbi:MAG TPA: class II aldolase/adducin family protein [Solirubrobacteraceae bacterium]|nr:class II aldolase/adducin family protein [Solirubrobacteraceae bacterium]
MATAKLLHDDDEAHAREVLAAAHRIAAYDGLAEGTWNHFSLMLDASRMLITPADRHWSLMDARSLVLAAGEEDARARGLQFLIGYRIHQPLHRVRPDAACVLHAHPPYATALSLLDEPALIPASQMSVAFVGRIAYNDRYDLIGGADGQGERIAAALGDNDVLLLRGHGVIVVGATVEEAYLDLYTFELACRSQVLAMSTGAALRPMGAIEVAELTASAPAQKQEAVQEARRHFAAMRELVDGGGPASPPAAPLGPVTAQKNKAASAAPQIRRQ